jgi:hypothetical protein
MARDKKAKKMELLGSENYFPNGMTPLYDAIALMVAEMHEQANEGDKVVITVVTDGMENDSKRTSLEEVRSLIKECEAWGWVFSYIGATPESWGGGLQMGVARESTLNVEGDGLGEAMVVQAAATSRFFAGASDAKSFYGGSD